MQPAQGVPALLRTCRTLDGAGSRFADPCLLLLLFYALWYAACGVPQVVSLHLQQEEEVEGSVTSATSLRTLVAASVMPTVTVLPKVSMLATAVISAPKPSGCQDDTVH
jgi:hypothetical protein